MTTTASVRFSENGAATVQSYVRLSASTHIQCCTYADAAPILSIQDGRRISRSPTPAGAR